MPKPTCIELPGHAPMPILFEDRSVLALDKPAGWMLVPFTWQKTNRNLQAAITSSIGAGHFWARSRMLRFLKHIHRLDADTTGILLFAKSPGALQSLGELFETRRMEKIYLAVTRHPPPATAWTCRAPLAPDPRQIGRVCVDRHGKEAETHFRVLASHGGLHLLEARPRTGRTHQIRVHLAEAKCPILGDDLYAERTDEPLALRAVGLAYHDPFTRREVAIRAPREAFLAAHGFARETYRLDFESLPMNRSAEHRSARTTSEPRGAMLRAPVRGLEARTLTRGILTPDAQPTSAASPRPPRENPRSR